MREASGHSRSRRLGRLLWTMLLAIVLRRLGWLVRRGRDDSGAGGAPVEKAPAWAEGIAVVLLLSTGAAAVAFVALFVLHPDTQLLALTLGGALALVAGALAVASRFLVPQRKATEHRPRLEDEEAVEEVAAQARGGVAPITRRRLLSAAAGAAGAGLGAAVIIPIAALGPGPPGEIGADAWRSGRLLIDDLGTPLLAAKIDAGSFVTAFPEGVLKDTLGAPVVVVRVDPASLRLPPERAGWAPLGILAYSKICTHAACAVSLYRSPLSPTTQARDPALVCPCHYSTFAVLDGGGVEFGPAGRPLPQLPLRIDAAGALRAAGPMSGPVGPSWWGDKA